MSAKKYTSSEHGLSAKDISKNAQKVLKELKASGFDAYIVGGAVRDLMLGLKPKDFDIATNAHPEQIKKIFRNCRLVGRRFRLAHVIFGREIIEVATFRANSSVDEVVKGRKVSEEGFLVQDNVYGTIEDDAKRRDFTINALYYDPIENIVLDFVDGVRDFKQQLIRLIGAPEIRFREDPVRMLRAIRFNVKLDFDLDEAIKNPITQMGYLLQTVSPARMFDEVIKLFLSGQGVSVFYKMREFQLFSQLFPYTERSLIDLKKEDIHLLITALDNSDRRYNEGHNVSAYFLYAALLWAPFYEEYMTLCADGYTPHEASVTAGHKTIYIQQKLILIPKRFSSQIIELWVFQCRLMNEKVLKQKRVHLRKLLSHARFKAALDFLLLRAEANESIIVKNMSRFWESTWCEYCKTEQK